MNPKFKASIEKMIAERRKDHKKGFDWEISKFKRRVKKSNYIKNGRKKPIYKRRQRASNDQDK